MYPFIADISYAFQCAYLYHRIMELNRIYVIYVEKILFSL